MLPAAGWRGKALVLRGGLRKLRKVWVRERLLTATVSGQQAPAPRTAMPAVPRLAEVIIEICSGGVLVRCSPAKDKKSQLCQSKAERT